MATKTQSYAESMEELDTIISLLQQDTIDIDEALEKYKRGLALTKELEVYLKDATNTIKEIKASIEKDS